MNNTYQTRCSECGAIINKRPNKINRFTTIPFLLDMLARKKLVLPDPRKWKDENDTELVTEYMKNKGQPNVFALCFLTGGETIHHWDTFASGTDGCCIEFDLAKMEKLLNGFRKNIKYGTVQYFRKEKVPKDYLEKIPFIKRWPYRCENEFRIVWIGKTKHEYVEIPIDLSIINKITLSGKLPCDVFCTMHQAINLLAKPFHIEVNPSTIYRNEEWIGKFKRKQNLNTRKLPG